MAGTAADALRVAVAELGYLERRTNITKYWAELAPGFQGQPWCAAFVAWVYRRAGVGLVSRSFYVPRIVVDYRAARRLLAVADAQPGDQVLFHIGDGHTGICESVDRRARTVTCIEGNTSPGVAGSQTNGGGVYRRTRPWAHVTGVGRPRFATRKVTPMFDPPISLEPIVATLTCPTGGFWQLATSGAVYAWEGAPFREWPAADRAKHLAGRTPARLELPDPDLDPPHAVYVIVTTSGERYAP